MYIIKWNIDRNFSLLQIAQPFYFLYLFSRGSCDQSDVQGEDSERLVHSQKRGRTLRSPRPEHLGEPYELQANIKEKK